MVDSEKDAAVAKKLGKAGGAGRGRWNGRKDWHLQGYGWGFQSLLYSLQRTMLRSQREVEVVFFVRT